MTTLFDRSQIQRTRERLACVYSSHAVFQHEVEKELVERLGLLNIKVNHVAVLGAGNVAVIDTLANRFTPELITLVDMSSNMLQEELRQVSVAVHPLVMSKASAIHEIPLPNASVDLVFSNIYFSFADDLMTLIDEVFRVLKPGGCVHFSCLGPDSFEQLRSAWRIADPQDVHHVIVPPDMHDIGDALVGAGFSEPVMDRTNFQLSYSSVKLMLEDLRNNGVQNYFRHRRPGLTSRKRWQEFTQNIQSVDDQRYLVTLESIIGQGWKPLKPRQHRSDDGSVSIPISTMFADIKTRQ